MGLYLCIFAGDEELEGVEVGSYADFGFFRDTVCQRLEDGSPGSQYPTLMLHSDCDGVWSPEEATVLSAELEAIARAFRQMEPVPWQSEWQRNVAKSQGLSPANLEECFIDVDGEPLLRRLLGLCRVSVQKALPILFQ